MVLVAKLKTSWCPFTHDATLTAMADAGSLSDFVDANFDLLAGNDELNSDNILQEVSAEEVEQVENAIEEATAQNEAMDMDEAHAFEEGDPNFCHCRKSEAEIDKYAENAHKDSTKHQTKWALNVFRGKSSEFSLNFFIKSQNKA